MMTENFEERLYLGRARGPEQWNGEQTEIEPMMICLPHE